MSTLSGAATLFGQRTPVSTEVNFSSTPPVVNKLKVGMTYPTNTGESQSEGTDRLFKEFPLARSYRVFRKSDQALPSWTSGLLTEVPNEVMLIVSSKNASCINELPGWLSSKPSRFTQPVVFCYWHEPDQYLTEGSSSGDPTPTNYQSNWQKLCSAMANHARRDELILAPIFTEYIARGSAKGVTAEKWQSTYSAVMALPQINAIGFDVYQTGFSEYRTPEHMWGHALEVCRSYNQPLVIGEWGIERRSSDPTGHECAQIMHDQADYLAKQSDTLALAWFYTGGDLLSSPEEITREPEYEAFQEIIQRYA